MTIKKSTKKNGEPQLLVVDDDAELCALLESYLEEHGYAVSYAGDGVEMDQFLSNNTADLVILDLMLPGEDGLSLAQRLRQSSNIPVIMLSARGEEIDRIIGLEMGADDYLAKPFNPRELLARIKALLRRSTTTQLAATATAKSYTFSNFHLDIVQQHLLNNNEPVALTTGEFCLLRVLVENPDQELSRDDLVQKLKGYERQPYDRSIDVCITRLRKKIEPDPSKPSFIHTVWGRGYIFIPTGDQT
ncbi:MAG: response regulator [Gammaproteobacteria bacterium]|nr:response regulator [Gammaproteobacteria bacterium]